VSCLAADWRVHMIDWSEVGSAHCHTDSLLVNTVSFDCYFNVVSVQ